MKKPKKTKKVRIIEKDVHGNVLSNTLQDRDDVDVLAILAAWEAQLASTYTDSVTGVVLNNDIATHALLSCFYSELSLSLASGIYDNNDKVIIQDANGDDQDFKVSKWILILGRYTKAWFAMWQEYSP